MADDRIQEHKRHLNKPDESYECVLLHRASGYLVLRYDVTRAGHIGPFAIPAGSLTIAHYRAGTPYVMWEMYGPARDLIGYCYHVCMPPEMEDASVSYLDLLLDLWFSPDGALTVLDEDELTQARDEGTLTPAYEDVVARARATIEADHGEILAARWRPPGRAQAP